MPDKKDKKKNPQGNNSFLDDYILVEGPEEEDKKSVASAPLMKSSAGNQFNVQEGQGSKENPSNESRNEEEDEEWNKMLALNMPEKDIKNDDLSFSMEKDAFGMPIISNELPGMKPGSVPSGSVEPLIAPKPVIGQKPQNAPRQKISPLGASWGYDEVPQDSVVQSKPRRKVKNTGDNMERIYNDPPIDNLDEIIEEEPKQENGQQQAGGYSFPAEHKPRTKVPLPRAAYDRATVIIGKTTAIPATLIGSPYFAVKEAVSAVKMHNAKKTMQEKREHDVIPGWNGAKFKKTANDTGAHILLDQRRVPTVWSRQTAGKAEDGNGNPTPPEVTAYFDQPKQGSSVNMVGTEMGHSMLGIEFSRYSRFTNRYERYKMKYGFYMAGGFNNTASQNALANRNALVPGALNDDYEHMYTVSRTYKATPAQVNSIVKASETYADGGYGYYRRNCTTFVKEMLVDVGKLETDGTIFEKEDARYTLLNNFFRWGGATFDAHYHASLKSQMAKFSKQDDLSYAGYGNKRVTKADLKNFDQTNSVFTLHPKTYAPAVAGENARRLGGKKSGRLGSFKYAGSMGTNALNATLSLSKLAGEISTESSSVAEAMRLLLPPEQQDPDQGMPQEVSDVLQQIYLMANSSVDTLDTEFNRLREKKNKPEAEPHDLFTADRIRECRQKNTEEMERAANLYRDFFKMDERLYIPFANLLSLYELANAYLDGEYQKASKAPLAQGDLGNIRQEMTEKVYTVSSGTAEAAFTPTHYESYIQIYKDAKTAINAYARYLELKKRREEAKDYDEDNEDNEDAAHGLSEAEEKEYRKLSRMEELAVDFDASHNYLLEKDAFTQQDIDYVFSMRRQEQHGIRKERNEMLTDRMDSASIYQAIFLEKIFGGMKQAWDSNESGGGMPDKDFNALVKDPGPKNFKKLAKWMDGYMSGRTEQKPKGMKMIIRGIYRSASGHTKDTLQEYMYRMISYSYFDRMLKDDMSERGVTGKAYFDPAFRLIMGDKKYKFTKLIRSISGEVIDEAAKAEKEAQAKAKAEQKQREKELKALKKAKKKK